jgi:hypothetical protein
MNSPIPVTPKLHKRIYGEQGIKYNILRSLLRELNVGESIAWKGGLHSNGWTYQLKAMKGFRYIYSQETGKSFKLLEIKEHGLFVFLRMN